ncbi:MAG: threonine dehydratase [Hyphomicrobiaceae bacterium]|jgi:threonine dehydratase
MSAGPIDPHEYLQRILVAPVYDVAIESPLDEAVRLSSRIGNHLFLKREDMQPIFSFKLRGAYTKMALLSPELRARGVAAASAGNHAQGVALAAARLGTHAVIVMPETTPVIKVSAVRGLGAEVILHGDSYSDAEVFAKKLADERGLTIVHPYDDPDVIAGQGTVGMEIVRQAGRRLDAIFVPVGGGGLAAGVASFTRRVRPDVAVIGVEPVDSDAMRQSIDAGHRVVLEHVGLFADGVAVRQVGEETFRLCRTLLDEVITVDNDEICAAIKDVFEDTRSILEPAGALAIAGAKAWVAREGVEGRTLVAIASGANMNFDRLRHVSERAEIGEHREALFAVGIPEHPGSFKAFCTLLGPRAVTEFNYRFADPERAWVFLGVQVDGPREAEGLLLAFRRAGLEAYDLTNDELSKLHIRHMVGGRATVDDELLLRFEFPERPGALMKFLEALSRGWNISLFHYRNHGADYGRVLVGVQVPVDQRSAFWETLEGLGYSWVDETEQSAYRLFVR